MRLSYLFSILPLGILLSWLMGQKAVLSEETQTLMAKAGQQLESQSLDYITTEGDIYLISEQETITQQQIHSWFKALQGKAAVYYYQHDIVGPFTVLAPDRKGDFHLGQHYLEGYAPFRINNPWLPMQVLAKKKRYQYDKDQAAGRVEAWQSSRQSYLYPTGDCEDHAILLADWLIHEGYDARVVLGDYDGGGHAWVVLFQGGNSFILEATKKSQVGRSYPLAATLPLYHPEYMFNRQFFWHNTGSKFTTDYRSSVWVKKSALRLP